MRICDECSTELDHRNWTIAVDDYEDLCDTCWKENNPEICPHCQTKIEMHEKCVCCEDKYVCEEAPGTLNEHICGECQENINPGNCLICRSPVHHKYAFCLDCVHTVHAEEIGVFATGHLLGIPLWKNQQENE